MSEKGSSPYDTPARALADLVDAEAFAAVYGIPLAEARVLIAGSDRAAVGEAMINQPYITGWGTTGLKKGDSVTIEGEYLVNPDPSVHKE